MPPLTFSRRARRLSRRRSTLRSSRTSRSSSSPSLARSAFPHVACRAPRATGTDTALAPSRSPVHLIGHYIRQEDFDQPPSDDEEDYGSEFDESGDYDSDELEGLIDGESEDDDMTDGEGRIEEIQEKPCVALPSIPLFLSLSKDPP